jgi:cysteine sulfinate desulfinase/cysteine desulfurase-like protein
LPGAALEAVRFSLGSTNTQLEVDQVAQWVEEIILQVRALSAPAGLSDKVPVGVSL